MTNASCTIRNLDKALALLDRIRNAPIPADTQATGTVSSAAQQLGRKLAWRAQQYEKREEYTSALSDFESAVLAAPEDEALRQTLSEFKQQHLDPN